MEKLSMRDDLYFLLAKGFEAIARKEEFTDKVLHYAEYRMTIDNIGGRFKSGVNRQYFAIDRAISNPNRVSWINLDKLQEKIDKGEKPESFVGYRKKAGTMTKIGRFLNRFFELSTSEIETISSYFIQQEKNMEFVIVEGDDIAKYYNEDCYNGDNGSLNSSCMRDMQKEVFNIYRDNCKLVIYRNIDTDMIAGRALLWEAADYNDDDITYTVLDRIYGNDRTIGLFKEFARKNNFIYKERQSYSDKDSFISGGSAPIKLNLKVNLCSSDYDFFPYLDTFTYLDMNRDILRNRDFTGAVELDSTTGEISRICCHNCNTHISENEISYINDCGETYCEECFDIYYVLTNDGTILDRDSVFYCDSCEYYNHIEDSIYIEDTEEHVCSYCADRYYYYVNGDYYSIDAVTECSQCGEYHLNEDTKEHGGKFCCPDCYEEAMLDKEDKENNK